MTCHQYLYHERSGYVRSALSTYVNRDLEAMTALDNFMNLYLLVWTRMCLRLHDHDSCYYRSEQL